MAINTHKLFSVGKIRLEPFIGFASYSIMIQFQQKAKQRSKNKAKVQEQILEEHHKLKRGVRIMAINTHKLFSVGKIRLEPFIGFASYSIMIQFQQKDRMIYRIKSFF